MTARLESIRLENSPHFDLTNPADRQKYFALKAGTEIKKLRAYLQDNTFIGYLLAKKMAGKGTYSKMLMELLEPNTLTHLSVGDLVRATHEQLEQEGPQRDELLHYLQSQYRGRLTLKQALHALQNRDTQSVSVPTELILALIKREIDRTGRQALFLDGFPRTLDQISYSLYFRELINYRDDPDFFILIDLPQSVIDIRIKERLICPICHTSRSFAFLPTKKVTYNKETKTYELHCDNPDCHDAVYVRKEGDELGVENIRKRLDDDHELIEHARNLSGVPIIQLHNSVHVDEAEKLFNDYELTPRYNYSLNKDGSVNITTEKLIINDDQGVPSHSLLPAPVVVSLLKQLVNVLEL